MNESFDNIDVLKKLMRGGLFWFAAALLLVTVTLFTTIRFGRVSGEEIGILLDKMNGNVQIIRTGVTPYNGMTQAFYVIDKTIQTLDMTSTNAGSINSELKIKTIDGSDVYLGLVVQFKIEEGKIVEVLETSGPGNLYKTKWVRDYIRSVCRDHLGELTTETFYDSSERELKIQASKAEINDKLANFGIIVDSIAPKKPRFYREYEAMIKKKKLADQAVLEEKSKELAAKERQNMQVVQATNKKNVAIEQFGGAMEQKKIKIKAEGEKVTKEADAYSYRVIIGSEARYYESQQKNEAILAAKKAEAKGIEAMKKALEGEGGLNMVKLEYAKKLKSIKVSGRPYSIDAKVEKMEHAGLKSAVKNSN